MPSSKAPQFLHEIKQRLFHYVASVSLLLLVFFYFSKPLYGLLAHPLLQQLSNHGQLIATQVTAPLITPLKLAWLVTLFCSAPIALYHLWAFVTPALYRKERRRLWPFIFLSLILFYLGLSFAYFVVFPLLFKFFSHQLPPQVVFMPDISAYLDFCTHLLFCFGMVFEIPIITMLLVYTGITSSAQLIRGRPFVIVGAFTLSMLLTPPDVLSQILLALPMWLLFEIGAWLSKRFS